MLLNQFEFNLVWIKFGLNSISFELSSVSWFRAFWTYNKQPIHKKLNLVLRSNAVKCKLDKNGFSLIRGASFQSKDILLFHVAPFRGAIEAPSVKFGVA